MAGTVKDTWDIACPECGRDDQMNIELQVTARLTPDGTETFGDHEWSSESDCWCAACNWQGQIKHATK